MLYYIGMSWGMFVQAAKTTLCTHGIFFLTGFTGRFLCQLYPAKTGRKSRCRKNFESTSLQFGGIHYVKYRFKHTAGDPHHCSCHPAILYFLGNKLQKRQLEQQQMLDAAAQTVSLLVIDKKKLKLTQAGLPKMVVDQTPKYMRWTKVPVVKAKIGPKIVTLIADARVFECLPVKTEAKVVLSGIYITQIKSVRGGSIPTPPKKKGFFARFRKDA